MASFIWAIDANGGGTSWAAWIKTAAISAPWETFETVWIYSVPDMVSKVIAAAGSDKISRLVLYGHAGSGYQAVGCGHLTDIKRTTNDFLAVSPWDGKLRNNAEQDLSRLVPCLASDARVSMGGCQVAMPPDGEPFLMRMAAVLGVTVEGGFWNQRPLFPGYEGPVLRCDGNTCTTITGPFKELR
jgi:hypothetical protein